MANINSSIIVRKCRLTIQNLYVWHICATCFPQLPALSLIPGKQTAFIPSNVAGAYLLHICALLFWSRVEESGGGDED